MFSFIALSWALTFGVVPVQTDWVGTETAAIHDISSFATLEVSALAWDRFRVFGSVETYQYLNSGKISFSPYRADYVFGAELIVTDNVLIGVEHECDHPVSSRVNLCSGVYSSDYNYASTETKIYVKITSQGR